MVSIENFIAYILTTGSAWIVCLITVIAIGCNAYYLRYHWHSPKRNLRIFNILACQYIFILYILLAIGVIPISATSAFLGRIAVTIALSLLIADVIADWKT